MPRTRKDEAPDPRRGPRDRGPLRRARRLHRRVRDGSASTSTRRPSSAACPTTAASARTGAIVQAGWSFRYADREEILTRRRRLLRRARPPAAGQRGHRGGRVQPDRRSCRPPWPSSGPTWPRRRSRSDDRRGRAGATPVSSPRSSSPSWRPERPDRAVRARRVPRRHAAAVAAAGAGPGGRVGRAPGQPPGAGPGPAVAVRPDAHRLRPRARGDLGATTGEAWYCRELFRADVGPAGITELAVYCTGDWDARTAAGARRGRDPDPPVTAGRRA